MKKITNLLIIILTLLLYKDSFTKITTNQPQPHQLKPIQTKIINKETIKVLIIQIKGPITPATTWYIKNKFDKHKNNQDIDFIMITIDSEGGLLSSMIDIVKLFFNSNHPIITLVYPQGSRAASAAMFILIAGHISTMTESTNTGASTPLVQDPTLQNKITQDLLAFTRNLCQKRNKNYEAIKETIINATSYTEKEALSKNVIDLIVQQPNQIFEKIKNKQIVTDTMIEVILKNFQKIEYIKEEPNLIESLFLFIANPSIAYFLLTIGFWAIIIELNHPGSLVPLIVGIICLSLGLFGLGIISANILGIILIIFSFILMLLELKIQSYGILTITGLITFIIGSTLIFKHIYQPLPIGIITLTSLSFISIFSYIAYAVLSYKKYGQFQYLPKIGKIVKIENGKIIVNAEGVLWQAIPKNPNTNFQINEEVIIEKIENINLIIDKKQ